MITALGVAWIASSIVLAPAFGRAIALQNDRGRLADVVPLFPPAARPEGKQAAAGGPPLPARLSPRAELPSWRPRRGAGLVAGLAIACAVIAIRTLGGLS